MEKNVAIVERWASLIGGGALLAYALRREPRWSPLSGVMALGAAELLFRGATGHCPAYGALGVNTADLGEDWSRPLSRSREGNGEKDKTFRGKWRMPEGARLVEPGERDVVEEASYASFPASDPPSFTPTKVG
ncbi:MAG TPA: DUF2892 domain-containing protein [Thermoanaerobaculia bacterium]|jgi:hypothetical protein|nr:DUF2892 domain-containing protein [Thermoanaerobaculia bacterium]